MFRTKSRHEKCWTTRERQQTCKWHLEPSCACIRLYIPCNHQVWLHGMHLVTSQYRFCVRGFFFSFLWVNVFACGWLGEWRSAGKYKLGRHIKNCVRWSRSCFTQCATHSLYFQAFQLVYNGTCQASLKALGMSLKLSRRETSTFPLLGTQPVRNIKEVNCQWIAEGGAVSDFDSLFVVWVKTVWA